jgi:hypothetical protein
MTDRFESRFCFGPWLELLQGMLCVGLVCFLLCGRDLLSRVKDVVSPR